MKRKKHQLQNKNHISVPKQPNSSQQEQQTKKPERQGPSYLFLQQKVETFKINSGPTNTLLPLFFFFLLLLLLLVFLPSFLSCGRTQARLRTPRTHRVVCINSSRFVRLFVPNSTPNGMVQTKP
jgi:hypothetical protein